jgi:hypothetical protein
LSIQVRKLLDSSHDIFIYAMALINFLNVKLMLPSAEVLVVAAASGRVHPP